MAAHKALALTQPGLTDLLAKEIKELTGISCVQNSNSVTFEASLEDIFTICYRSHLATRVLIVVSHGQFDKLSIPKEHLTGTISITGASTTKADELGELLHAKKVYKNADTPFYLHTENDDNWLGIDLTGDMSKRDYRIFIGPETLNGISAAGALMLSGYEPKHALIDPFCRAGSITIEAALTATQRSPRHYSKTKFFTKIFKDTDFDKLFSAHDKKIKEAKATITALSPFFPSVQASRKNAKIAGIVKEIDFSRTATDWLDLKFDKASIDRIVTQPTEFGVNFPQAKAQKLAQEFFKPAAFILKPAGKICLILRHGKENYITAAKENNFSIEHERTIMQGKEAWNVIVFSRK